MSIFKKLLTALIATVLVVGMIPMGAMAETFTETHVFTIPTASAGGSDEPLIKIGTISDSHTDYGLQNKAPYIRPAYITAINALKAEGIDILLHGGDITSDNEDNGGNLRWEKSVYDRTVAAYKEYSSAVSKTGITLWACGNHDHEVGRLTNGVSEGDYDSYAGFMQMMIDTAGQPKSLLVQESTDALANGHWLGAHYVVKGFDFIIINPPYTAATYYDTKTLSWLDTTLAGIGADKHVFIIGHYPLYDSRNMTRNDDYGIKGTNYTNFMNVMKKYDKAVYFYGHNHGDGDSTFISADSFERITHYSENGKTIDNRKVTPTSFITSFMGSASFYKNSIDTNWLGAADPSIIQSQVVTVYKDRIEFKVINCGKRTGSLAEPLVWATNGGEVYVEPVEPLEKWDVPDDLTTTTGWSKDNFALYYMNMTDSILKNDWDQSGSSYVNLTDGHKRGTFDKRSNSAIRVFPEVGKSAVIQFTAPKDGIYQYDASVYSYAKTGGGGNKQVRFSVMKNGVILDITQPNNTEDYSDDLVGTVSLKKGETLLFVSDFYVQYYNSTLLNPADRGSDGGWMAAYYSKLSVGLINETADSTSYSSYKLDGSGFKFTSNGYSVKNGNFSIVALNYANKSILTTAHGTTGGLDAAVYNGNVTIAYRTADSKLMVGPFGSGNSSKNIASAIAFTAPSNGTYNLTALLLHEKDYVGGKNSSINYEILDSGFNVLFSGSTTNLYTAGNVENTYARAAANAYLNKGETVYLVFKPASSATELTSDAMATQIVSLNATVISLGCAHKWEHTTDKCTICGETCNHTFANGVCSTCGKVCTHTWKNGVCTVCKKTCEHATYTNGKCTVCKADCQHDWMAGSCLNCHVACTHSWKDGKCSVCGIKCSHTYGDDNTCDTCGYVNTGAATTDPSNTTKPGDTNPTDTTDPDNTTKPSDTNPTDTTDPDNTTKPSDTTAPDNGAQNKGGDKNDSSVLIAVLIVVGAIAVAAVVIIVFAPKKAKK